MLIFIITLSQLYGRIGVGLPRESLNNFLLFLFHTIFKKIKNYMKMTNRILNSIILLKNTCIYKIKFVHLSAFIF